MKKIFLYFSLLIFPFSFCHAQDTIVFKDGKKTVGKVTSVDDFVNYTDVGGKTKYHRIGSVSYIHYSSGEIYSPNRSAESITDESIAPHKKFFSIYNEPMLSWFCESENIGVEAPVSNRITVGLNYAVAMPQAAFYVNPLSSAQANWPGTVYSGYCRRLNMKVFDKYHLARYTAFQFVAKSLRYRNVTFYDQPLQDGDNGIYYTRNEDETVLGTDIVRGHEYALFNNTLLIDYYYGFGLRDKLRHIDTWNINGNPGGDNITNGYTFQNRLLPTPLLGVRIGFNFYKRSNKKFPVTIGAPRQTVDGN